MVKTATVSELRAEIADYLKRLEDGPILVMSRSRPTAVLVDPVVFDAMLERIELLEDLLDGRTAVAEYLKDSESAIDAEEVFRRLGR